MRLRGLRLASSSELIAPMYSKMRQLLESLEGIEFSRAGAAGRVLWFWRHVCHQ